MKEKLTQLIPIPEVEVKLDIEINEPKIELLGSIKEFSRSKRWFRDTTPIPDVG